MTPNALVQLTHRQILEVILRVTRSLILYKVYKKYLLVITSLVSLCFIQTFSQIV